MASILPALHGGFWLVRSGQGFTKSCFSPPGRRLAADVCF